MLLESALLEAVCALRVKQACLWLVSSNSLISAKKGSCIANSGLTRHNTPCYNDEPVPLLHGERLPNGVQHACRQRERAEANSG